MKYHLRVRGIGLGRMPANARVYGRQGDVVVLRTLEAAMSLIRQVKKLNIKWRITLVRKANA